MNNNSFTVTNPLNDQKVNLQPLFELMADETLDLDGSRNLVRRVQRVHDYISTRPPRTLDHDELNEWIQANGFLIQLRKTFEQMEVDPAKVQAPAQVEA